MGQPLLFVPKQIVIGYVAVLSALYIVVATHTPIVVHPLARYDDGLFITLGRHLAEGEWLGPFSQFTLIKGRVPGILGRRSMAAAFPLRWLRHYFTASPLRFRGDLQSLHKIIYSIRFDVCSVLWHPITLSVHLLRVFHEEIYYGQVLLVIAAVTAAMFSPFDTRRRVPVLHLGGNGLGMVLAHPRGRNSGCFRPSAIIVSAGGWGAYRAERPRQLLAPLSIIICIFVF